MTTNNESEPCHLIVTFNNGVRIDCCGNGHSAGRFMDKIMGLIDFSASLLGVEVLHRHGSGPVASDPPPPPCPAGPPPPPASPKRPPTRVCTKVRPYHQDDLLTTGEILQRWGCVSSTRGAASSLGKMVIKLYRSIRGTEPYSKEFWCPASGRTLSRAQITANKYHPIHDLGIIVLALQKKRGLVSMERNEQYSFDCIQYHDLVRRGLEAYPTHLQLREVRT